MALPLTDEEQDLLLASLAELVAARGPAPLLAAPIEPTEAFFPDRYVPGAEGARVVAERLLGYAGLGRHRAVMEVGDGQEVAGPDGGPAAAWFRGVEGFRCFFGVDEAQLGEPELLVASLAHEVAHAYRHVHGLRDGGALEEEPATDATTVFLGFGVLTTNATFRFRTAGLDGSSYRGHTVSQASLGYLPPQAMAFLLAAQALARGAGWSERRRLAGLLETNQGALFAAAHAALSRRGAGALARLGIPAGAAGTPAPRPSRRVEPPVAQAASPASAAPRAAPPRPRGPPTFRVPGGTRPMAGLAGAALAALPILFAALLVRRAWVMALAAPLSAWTALRWGHRRPDRCADPACEAELPPEARSCPGCGRRVAGTIRRPEDRLEAEERLRAEDAHDREALRGEAGRDAG
jgi:hypothetical protein